MSILGVSIRKKQATPESQDIPRHVAIIMDGNGRWAKRRLMPRVAGHRKGVEALRGVIEEFVTRDGAVHGHSETPMSQQVEAVRRQLMMGKAVIVFDEESESCTICLKEDARSPKLGRGGPKSP